MSIDTGTRPRTLTYLRIVEEVTSTGLTHRDVAGLVGVTARTVQSWATGRTSPTGARMRRLLDLRHLVAELRSAYTDAGVLIWLGSRNHNLGGERPADLLAADADERVLHEAHRVARAM